MKMVSMTLLLLFGFATIASAESLEKLIDRAVNNNPNIAAARAKVALAQAELNVAQMEVAREVVALHGEREVLMQKFSRMSDIHEKSEGVISIQELISIKSKIAQIDTQLQHLVGKPQAHNTNASGMLPGTTPSGKAGTSWKPAEADKFAKVLNSSVSLEFHETPIEDVLEFLEDMVGIKMATDWSTKDMPVTLRLRDMPLGASLQAIEDVCEVRFVVREYGILAVAANRANDRNALFAVDFWRQTAQDSKSNQTNRKAP